MSEEIDRMIIEQETIVNIERKASRTGHADPAPGRPAEGGRGLTTLEEVLRVVV